MDRRGLSAEAIGGGQHDLRRDRSIADLTTTLQILINLGTMRAQAGGSREYSAHTEAYEVALKDAAALLERLKS